MTIAAEVADYLIALAHERGEMVNNLKLQRLLYYAQAWHLGMFGVPLFAETFEAWMTGPVIPAMYSKYKPHGIDAIPAPAAWPEMPHRLAAFLGEIADDYLPIDEYDLEAMARSEPPWQVARGPLDPGEPCRAAISEDEMRAYFHALGVAAA